MKIISNNPMVKDYFNREDMEYIDGTYQEVLLKTRDYIHKHCILLTHPLSGSVKPNETLYKTIAIEQSDSLHYDSLHMIDEAIRIHDHFQRSKNAPNWSDSIKDDFMVIDLDLIRNALRK